MRLPTFAFTRLASTRATPHFEQDSRYVPRRLTFAPGVASIPKRTDLPPEKPSLTATDYLKRAPSNLQVLLGENPESFARTRGKFWLAPEGLIRADVARHFPNVSGQSPRRESRCTADMLPGHVSLVCIINSKLSEQQIQTYLSSTTCFKKHVGNPLFQHIQIMHVAKPAFGPLAWLFYKERQSYEQHELIQLFTVDDFRRKAFYEHSEHAYIYVVDPRQRIRWAAVGAADQQGEEVQALDACLDKLLQRASAGLLDW